MLESASSCWVLATHSFGAAKPTLETNRSQSSFSPRSRRASNPLLAWAVVCGKAVADRTAAQTFTDGELQVTVPDRGWKKELAMLRAAITSLGINRIVGKDVVQRITFMTADSKKSR